LTTDFPARPRCALADNQREAISMASFISVS